MVKTTAKVVSHLHSKHHEPPSVGAAPLGHIKNICILYVYVCILYIYIYIYKDIYIFSVHILYNYIILLLVIVVLVLYICTCTCMSSCYMYIVPQDDKASLRFLDAVSPPSFCTFIEWPCN